MRRDELWALMILLGCFMMIVGGGLYGWTTRNQVATVGYWRVGAHCYQEERVAEHGGVPVFTLTQIDCERLR